MLLLGVILCLPCVVADLRARIIPNRLTLGGLSVALLSAAASGPAVLADSVLGALVTGGVLLLAAMTVKGGVGGGDIKMGAMIGALLGFPACLPALGLACASGAVVGTVLQGLGVLPRPGFIPFAPFLALGCLAASAGGERALTWLVGGTG